MKMDIHQRKILIDIMYETIREEGLPNPNKILIRHPTRGKQHSKGALRKVTLRISKMTIFNITITIASPKYIPDENGKFWLKNDKNKRFKFIGWHEQNREDIINTCAHEIAHLKFWSHDAEHTGYTKYLYDILNKKLENWNVCSLL